MEVERAEPSRMRRRKNSLSLLKTLGVALFGVACFALLHLPLPWLLGALSAVMLFRALTGERLYWPLFLRQVALLLLGYTLGTSFTEEALRQMVTHVPSMLFVTVTTLLASMGLGMALAKATGLDRLSCLFGSIPGGLTQMIVLSEEVENVDATVVVFIQMMRVMVVVFIVPFLTVYGWHGAAEAGEAMQEAAAQAWAELPVAVYLLYPLLLVAGTRLARRAGLPTADLLGPFFVTAAVSLAGFPAPPPPDPWIAMAQLFLGVHMGLQMQPRQFANWRTMLTYTLLTSVALVLVALGLGYFLTLWHPVLLQTAFLSTAPGGIAEMGVTAAAVGADLSVVSSYQLFRVLWIMFVVPPFLKWLAKWSAKKNKSASAEG